MSNLTKALILIVAILAIGVGLVVWKKKVAGQSNESFNSISREEIEMLLADVSKTNPMILKKLAEDPEMKKQQIDNLKQLLAFASQAKRDGLTDDPTNRQELENIRSEIVAVNYDREINKDKGPMPAFGFITDDMVKAYWAEDEQPKAGPGLLERIGFTGPTEQRTHQVEFDDFLNAKIQILKTGNPEMKDREISEEEKTQARDIFAKIRIYKNEYNQKLAAGTLTKDFIDRTNLQVKLQQAQFLARLFSEKVTDKTKVTDEEVAQYITAHPELDPAQKKATAQGILDRAKAGEDFAALANEFSQDPGNKGPDGAPQGGIYKDVPKGRMVAPFEAAALALQPGQVSPELVETDFGYHIIKLERKLEAKPAAKTAPSAGAAKEPAKAEETYDVRHILISTGVKDPDNPTAREAPVKDYVRNKLETEKEKKVIDDIVAANNVQVPADFTVPAVSEEQLQQMRQKQQMQMPQGMPPGGPGAPGAPGGPEPGKPAKPEPKKPEPKKTK
ncbi:MAG: peptidylprolyl isomerase [Pyrinomonadaceae bacterium]